jgi:hypothetical protein
MNNEYVPDREIQICMQESLKYGGENLERAALAKSALLRLTQRLGIPVTQIGDLVQAVLKSVITP